MVEIFLHPWWKNHSSRLHSTQLSQPPPTPCTDFVRKAWGQRVAGENVRENGRKNEELRIVQVGIQN